MFLALMERNPLPKRNTSVLLPHFVFKLQVLFSRRDLNWITVIIPICYMPHALYPLTHLILTTILQDTCGWFHFMDENIEAQTDMRTCAKQHSW